MWKGLTSRGQVRGLAESSGDQAGGKRHNTVASRGAKGGRGQEGRLPSAAVLAGGQAACQQTGTF